MRSSSDRLRSGLLAAWATAWFDGAVAADDVLDAVTGNDAPHEVVGLPDTAAGSLGAALIALRGRAPAVRLVLPVPGDLRGLPAGSPALREAALGAGEAVVCGDLTLVPSVTANPASSAPTRVVWTAFVLDPPLDDPLDVPGAAQDLAVAMRETAGALQAASLDAARADVGDGLARARRAGERLDLPAGFPSRAVALVAQAERLTAVLDLVDADPLGGAVDRAGVDQRRAALAPLAAAVRRARVAGYNAGGEQAHRNAVA